MFNTLAILLMFFVMWLVGCEKSPEEEALPQFVV